MAGSPDTGSSHAEGSEWLEMAAGVGDFVTGHRAVLGICVSDSSSLVRSAPEFGGRILHEMMKVNEVT